MRLANLRIENYKGLRDIDVPLSSFVCLIGENSAGKSSVLQALSLWFSGTALAKTHYFDDSRDVRIEVSLEGIEEDDVRRLAEEHRSKIGEIIKNGALTLARIYGSDGRSSLKFRKLCPRDLRFSDEKMNELMKGKKPGKPFAEAVVAQFPELDALVTPTMNQTEMRTAVQELADALPGDQKTTVDADLPTGIDKSISAMLPDAQSADTRKAAYLRWIHRDATKIHGLPPWWPKSSQSYHYCCKPGAARDAQSYGRAQSWWLRAFMRRNSLELAVTRVSL
jgi:putative ATP-dependent endonuclease of the OLD family